MKKITADLPDDLVMRVDEWAAPRMLTRQEAIGRLLARSLDGA